MNAENFAEIIKNPAQLYQISYHELKTLVLQYPFCRNLHHLLLQKSQLDNHKDFERILEKTAASSFDRRHLYHQLHAVRPEGEPEEVFGLEEDYLELLDLSSLEKKAEKISVSNEGHPESPEEAGLLENPPDPFPKPDPRDRREEEEIDLSLLDIPETADLFPPPAEPTLQMPPVAPPVDTFRIVQNIGSWLEVMQNMARMIAPVTEKAERIPEEKSPLEKETDAMRPADLQKSKQDPAKKSAPKPLPKKNFSSWSDRSPFGHFSSFHPGNFGDKKVSVPPKSEPAPDKPGNKKKKEKAIIEFAEQSLRPHEDVASETLAELLVSQERYRQAIQMYERLILIFPEKSSFFAQKIEQLKKYL